MRNQTLFTLIQQHFDSSELGVLCYSLFGLNYNDDLKGTTHAEKIISLIGWCKRRGVGPDLVERFREERSHVTWPDWVSVPSSNDRTDVLESDDNAQATHPGEVQPQLDSVSTVDEPYQRLIDQIASFLMSNPQNFLNPAWFYQQREAMETSFSILSSSIGQTNLMADLPDLALEAQDACDQICKQTVGLLSFLRKVGLDPHRSAQQHALYNNLFLARDRANEATKKLDRLIDLTFADTPPSLHTLTDVERALAAIRPPTDYTLRWLNQVIHALDQLESH